MTTTSKLYYLNVQCANDHGLVKSTDLFNSYQFARPERLCDKDGSRLIYLIRYTCFLKTNANWKSSFLYSHDKKNEYKTSSGCSLCI